MGNILTVAVAKFLDPHTHNHLELPVKGTGGMPFTFAQCCMPIPGDDIIAHIAQERGVVIHTKSCKNLRQSELGPGKSLNVTWNYAVTSNMDFKAGLQIDIENRQGIVSEISNAVDIAGSRIESINSDLLDEKTFKINLVVSVHDRDHLSSVIKRIKAVPNVLTIYRRK